MGDFRKSGNYKPCNVTRVNPDGTYDVEYEEGGVQFNAPESMLYKLDDEEVAEVGELDLMQEVYPPNFAPLVEEMPRIVEEEETSPLASSLTPPGRKAEEAFKRPQPGMYLRVVSAKDVPNAQAGIVAIVIIDHVEVGRTGRAYHGQPFWGDLFPIPEFEPNHEPEVRIVIGDCIASVPTLSQSGQEHVELPLRGRWLLPIVPRGC